MSPDARSSMETTAGAVDVYRLDRTGADLDRLPHTVKILLENLLRRAGSRDVSEDDVAQLARWPAGRGDVAYMPTRVLMQDFTGVPAGGGPPAVRSPMAPPGGGARPVEPPLAVGPV